MVYATGQRALWRSNDGGRQWTRATYMMEGMFRRSQFLLDGQDPHVVYAPTADLWSRDGGRSWHSLDQAQNGISVRATHPGLAGRLYGTSGPNWRLAISDDHGSTWRESGGTGSAVWASPTAPQEIYTRSPQTWDPLTGGIAAGAIHYSGDGGHTWAQWDLPRYFSSLVLDAGGTGRLYATSGDSLYHSLDHGARWDALLPGRGEMTSHTVTAHPTQTGVVALYGFNSLRISRNGGLSWEMARMPGSIRQLVFDPVDSYHLYCIASSGAAYEALESTDGGQTWEALPQPQMGPFVGALLADPSGQLTVGSARLDESGRARPVLLQGRDGGPWEVRGSGTASSFWLTPIEQIAADPHDPDLLLAEFGTTFALSRDGGASWQATPTLGGSSTELGTIRFDPLRPGTAYVAESFGGVWRMSDGGTSWDRVLSTRVNLGGGAFTYRNVMGLEIDPSDSEVMYVAMDTTMMRTVNGGASWEEYGDFGGRYFRGLARHPHTGHFLAFAYDLDGIGLYLSLDRGWSWSLLSSLDWLSEGYLFRPRIRFHPTDALVVYLLVGPELLESRDGGRVWHSIGDGLMARPYFLDVATVPGEVEELYATTPWGLYRLDERATAIDDEGAPLPRGFALEQNFPNPFNASTTIRYSVPTPGRVDLAVYNLLGQQVRSLVREPRDAGAHRIVWDGLDEAGRPVATGVYLYRLRTSTHAETRKLLLLE